MCSYNKAEFKDTFFPTVHDRKNKLISDQEFSSKGYTYILFFGINPLWLTSIRLTDLGTITRNSFYYFFLQSIISLVPIGFHEMHRSQTLFRVKSQNWSQNLLKSPFLLIFTISCLLTAKFYHFLDWQKFRITKFDCTSKLLLSLHERKKIPKLNILKLLRTVNIVLTLFILLL